MAFMNTNIHLSALGLVYGSGTHGQCRAAERDWPASSKRHRARRVVRESKTVNALAYLGWCALCVGAAWAYSTPVVQSFLAAVRGLS